MRTNSLVGIGILLLSSICAIAQAGTCAGMTVGQLTSLNGFVPFPSDNLWNADISGTPVDPNSANIINFIGSTVTLHPDFGSGQIRNQTIGIPYQVVAGTQAKVNVRAILGRSQLLRTRSSRVIRSRAMGTDTCSCLKKTAAGFTSFTMPL